MKEWIKKHKVLYMPLKLVKDLFIKPEAEEQRKIYGLKNMTKTFYVIRNFRTRVGLMSCHNHILHHIRYAIERNYIPIIDMKNYPSMYQEKDRIGVDNVWEFYFKQPTDITLEEVYKSWNVILSSNEMNRGYRGIDDKSDIEQCHNAIEHYMNLNEVTRQYVDNELEKLLRFSNNGKVLGVCCRGSDYTSTKPTQHAIPTSAEECIEIVKDKMKEWGYEYIYLATEDVEIHEKFRDAFGSKMYSVECYRYPHNTGDKLLAELHVDRENDKYMRGLEYVITVYLLALCDSVITPVVGAGLAAVRINGNKYRNVLILDKGIYD